MAPGRGRGQIRGQNFGFNITALRYINNLFIDDWILAGKVADATNCCHSRCSAGRYMVPSSGLSMYYPYTPELHWHWSILHRCLQSGDGLIHLASSYNRVQQNYFVSVKCFLWQWCRQDLLQGGAEIEIRSWGTYDGLQGRVQQLLDD